LARPRTVDISNKTKQQRNRYCNDVSGSAAKDLKLNRMEALKRVAADFVQERPNDRICGLCPEAYIKTPVTSTKQLLKKP
jgi:Ca-activated chloride channel family protein